MLGNDLMADVPFGVLLSGGLDSSLIASITNRIIREKPVNHWGQNLHSFSIGLKDAPDLKAAKEVADFWELYIMNFISPFKMVLMLFET